MSHGRGDGGGGRSGNWSGRGCQRASGKDDVWTLDFAHERTEDGRPLKILAVADEHTRGCLALIVGQRMRSGRVIETLRQLLLVRGVHGTSEELV